MTGVLLDTCAVLWYSAGQRMEEKALDCLASAAMIDGIYVSPVSIWEIGLLAARGRLVELDSHAAVQRWFTAFIRQPGIVVTPLTPEAAMDATFLPDLDHRDPGDRFLIATARQLDVPVVTRDWKIIDYARTGHVKCIAC